MPSINFVMPFRPAFDSNAIGIPGAQLAFYETGTLTPKPVYQDAGLSVEHPHPIVANAAGRFPQAFLDDAESYRLRIFDKDANISIATPIEEFDPYTGILQGAQGPSGPAGNISANLADLKDAAITDVARILGPSTFNWIAGNFTGKANDVNIVQSDHAPLSTGAWVASALATDTGAQRTTVHGVGAWEKAEGQLNVIIGWNTGKTITDGAGSDAGLNNGQGVTVVGAEALAGGAGYSYDYSCFYGYNSGYGATGGYCTTALGIRTGMSLQPGADYNTFIGCDAGKDTTTGAGNTFIGAKSGIENESGYDNTGIGASTGYHLTSGFGNFLGGSQAGYNLTTGYQNIAIGDLALSTLTASASNIAIGKWALRLLTSGVNIAIGADAAGALTSGSGGVYIGTRAFYSASAASNQNVFIGDVAGENAAAVSQCCVIGAYSGQHLETSATLVGYEAGRNISSGAYNSFIGRSAGTSQTTGALNTGLGDSALGAAVTANSNTAIGALALNSVTAGGNTATGAQAGDSITTGSSNSLFGAETDTDAADAAGVIAIGRGSIGKKATGATSAHAGPGLSIGSSGYPVAVRGDATLYPAAGVSAGFMVLNLNGTDYKIELLAMA